MSGAANLRELLRLRGKSKPTRVLGDTLDRVGLGGVGHRTVGHYSKGMRQRLALAYVIAADTPVILLDEPTDGLDPRGVADLRTLLRDLRDSGKAIIASSHALGELEHSADRVVVLHHGRVVADDRPGSSRRESERRFIRATPRHLSAYFCHSLTEGGLETERYSLIQE